MLSRCIQSCLARSAEAERLAELESDAAAKAELLSLASSWRQVAAKYRYVAKLEGFLKAHHPADYPVRKQ
jgi:hypothetical protein